jgi:hypothetical protein
VIYPSVGKYILLGVKKAKISLQSPKTKFGAQNRAIYNRVTYSRIENFTWSKKKYFWEQKCKNKPSEPKNGIWAPKSISSCDISIDQELKMEQEKMYFWGSYR